MGEKLFLPIVTSLIAGILLLSLEYRSGYFLHGGGPPQPITPTAPTITPLATEQPPTSPPTAEVSSGTEQRQTPAPREENTLQVYANQGWQDTGVYVSAGTQVKIEYVSGFKSHRGLNSGEVLVNASG